MMATHMTVDDLANFLRARKSPDCKMAADWAAENPENEAVKKEVDALEEYVWSVAGSMDMEMVALAEAHRTNGATGLPRSMLNMRSDACFSRLAGRFEMKGWKKLPAWKALVQQAQDLMDQRAPSWAAHISRRLKKAQAPKPAGDEEEGPYTVEFLLVKRVRVRATDDIQAELEAARKLSPAERAAVYRLRVFFPDGRMVSDVQSGPDDGFWTPDKGQWDD